jgi:hypothetical protein
MEMSHDASFITGFFQFTGHNAEYGSANENAVIPLCHTNYLPDFSRQHSIEVPEGKIQGRKSKVTYGASLAVIMNIIDADIFLSQDFLRHTDIALVDKASPFQDAIIAFEQYK